MDNIPTNELGMVDIKLYVFDTLKNYVPLLELVESGNIMFANNSRFKDRNKSSVVITDIGSSTNSLGIRLQGFQIDVFSPSLEELEKVKSVIVDLFNRREFKGIKSRLVRTGPNMNHLKKELYREILDFDFIFKDMKF